MNKKIIIVEGYLASGKSTFARKLSQTINVPCFVKDAFKIALFERIGCRDRGQSLQFSAITFDGMAYAAERMMETGYPVILEGNFVPAGVKKTDEAGVLRHLIAQYGYASLTFKFTGDTHVLYKRFVAREQTPERGNVNKMGIPFPYEDFDEYCHNLDAFDVGGETVRIDTTDFGAIDFQQYFDTAQRFLKM